MKPPSLAPCYLYLVPLLADVAREKGYALTVHGSMQRDLDLVAVPWIEGPAGPEELVGALFDRIRFTSPADKPRGPVQRPHGRLGWVITLDGGAYVDLSVMPTRAQERGDP